MNKSRKLLFNLFLCAYALLHMQMAFAAVPGQSLWCIAENIESKICSLDYTIPKCDFRIHQEDIGEGDIYTITEPGYYCFVESVSFNQGVAVTINSDDVILDLNCHTIDGLSSGDGDQAILITANRNNITIKNGGIANITDDGITANGVFSNIVVEDITIINANIGGGGFASFEFAFSDASNCLRMKNCKVIGNGQVPGYQFDGINFVIEDCVAIDSIVGFEAFGGDHIVFKNCTAGGTNPGSLSAGNGFSTNANSTIFRDCEAYNYNNSGFVVGGTSNGDVDNVVFENCIASNCGATGQGIFSIRSGSSATVKNIKLSNCTAQGSISTGSPAAGFEINGIGGLSARIENVVFKNCISQDNQLDGFLITGNGGQIENISYKQCCAQTNNSSGFRAEESGGGDYINLTYEECISQENGIHGFDLTAIIAGSTINDVSYDKCKAQNNVTSGFNTNTTPGDINRVIYQYCTAQNNGSDGFVLDDATNNCKILHSCASRNGLIGINNIAGSASTTNAILGNTSFDNTGGPDIFDPMMHATLLVSRSLFPGAVAGAVQWVNIIS